MSASAHHSSQDSTQDAPTRAAVILPAEGHGGGQRTDQSRLAEAVNLAESIGLHVAYTSIVHLRAHHAATLMGEGQVAEIGHAIEQHDVAVTVVDAPISPVQQRNLEQRWNCKVVDRTGLILDIFGERARTKEGALQVELAHLEYQRSRLVRSWTHLGRQRGGFGFLGGPGETQLEADRRIMRDRIARLRQELEDVRRTRGLHRRARQRAGVPVVALVGYTNAGKSTLFNKLTGANVLAESRVFATLDPTLRSIELPSGRHAALSDTVGFISELPTQLVAAFRATLEEVAEADVILHVQDAAQPDVAAQRADVIAVLDSMVRDDMLDSAWPSRTIDVLNKADLLDQTTAVQGRRGGVLVSARTGDGLDALKAAIDARLSEGMQTVGYDLPLSDGAELAWLYEHGEVIGRQDRDDAIHVTVRLSPLDRERFEHQHAVSQS